MAVLTSRDCGPPAGQRPLPRPPQAAAGPGKAAGRPSESWRGHHPKSAEEWGSRASQWPPCRRPARTLGKSPGLQPPRGGRSEARKAREAGEGPRPVPRSYHLAWAKLGDPHLQPFGWREARPPARAGAGGRSGLTEPAASPARAGRQRRASRCIRASPARAPLGPDGRASGPREVRAGRVRAPRPEPSGARGRICLLGSA